jgi:hypothetical protein
MYRKVIFLKKMKSSVICFLKFEMLKYFKIVKKSKIKVPGTKLNPNPYNTPNPNPTLAPTTIS